LDADDYSVRKFAGTQNLVGSVGVDATMFLRNATKAFFSWRYSNSCPIQSSTPMSVSLSEII